ncbi:hypothetical protein BJX96DRAFT_145127 [Aspergillus floccosus]
MCAGDLVSRCGHQHPTSTNRDAKLIQSKKTIEGIGMDERLSTMPMTRRDGKMGIARRESATRTSRADHHDKETIREDTRTG